MVVLSVKLACVLAVAKLVKVEALQSTDWESSHHRGTYLPLQSRRRTSMGRLRREGKPWNFVPGT